MSNASEASVNDAFEDAITVRAIETTSMGVSFVIDLANGEPWHGTREQFMELLHKMQSLAATMPA